MARALRELTSATLADQAYDALRDAIVSGELAPAEKVTERGLADRLSISVTPIREAIRRLEQDRLIVRTGPRSVRVADVSHREVLELATIEATLRALAAGLAATNATDAQLDRMGKALDAADAEVDKIAKSTKVSQHAEKALLQLREFHDQVDRACGNDVLLHLLSTVEAFTRADRVAALHDQIESHHDEGPARRYRDHRTIYEALLARDAGQAEALMLEHTRSSAREVAASASTDR